jgi:uncharacterized membrane protein SpoIIM required for sporulation
VIVDLDRFLRREQPHWNALERELDRLEADSGAALTLEGAQQLFELYQRASSGLAKVIGSAPNSEIRSYLEALVSRAYGEVHESRRARRIAWSEVWTMFPRAFRRHYRAFVAAVAITLCGALFGGVLVAIDPEAKSALLPFAHLLGNPSERVAEEEAREEGIDSGARAYFSSELMVHNTRVAIFCLALGITWGIGTSIVLFYNGVVLGAVCFDYLQAGEGVFLVGWLLPHGSIEIPAILIAGQAGLALAATLLDGESALPLGDRLRELAPSLMALISGVAAMLVWAGLVEAFVSQDHEPALSYGLKIGFGLIEVLLLSLFLWRAGRTSEEART